MSDQAVTDLSYLQEMAMGDEEIVIETTEVFLENTPEALEEIKNLYTQEKWDELAKLVHKIKPNFSYMGMNRARELLLDIEEQAKSSNISDELPNQITEFSEICNRAFDELSTEIEQLKTA